MKYEKANNIITSITCNTQFEDRSFQIDGIGAEFVICDPYLVSNEINGSGLVVD